MIPFLIDAGCKIPFSCFKDPRVFEAVKDNARRRHSAQLAIALCGDLDWKVCGEIVLFIFLDPRVLNKFRSFWKAKASVHNSKPRVHPKVENTNCCVMF